MFSLASTAPVWYLLYPPFAFYRAVYVLGYYCSTARCPALRDYTWSSNNPLGREMILIIIFLYQFYSFHSFIHSLRRSSVDICPVSSSSCWLPTWTLCCLAPTVSLARHYSFSLASANVSPIRLPSPRTVYFASFEHFNSSLRCR